MRQGPPAPRPVVVDPMIAKKEAIRKSFLQKRTDMTKQRDELMKERLTIETAEQASTDAIVAPTVKQLQYSGSPVDYTLIPTDLDAALEKLDLEGSLRPAIINVGKTWMKREQKGG